MIDQTENKVQKLTFRFNTIEVADDRRGGFRAVGTKVGRNGLKRRPQEINRTR